MQYDIAIGAMLGAAYGDALGWPQERADRNEIEQVSPGCEHLPRHWVRVHNFRGVIFKEPIVAGSYSDDTQLIIALTRAVLKGDNWFEYYTQVELPLWTLYDRGGGYSTKQAIKAWIKGNPPWSVNHAPNEIAKYFTGGGNGVAMRILPHVLWGRDLDFSQVAQRIFLDGITTHGHPQALVGALAYGYALWSALVNIDSQGNAVTDAGKINESVVLPYSRLLQDIHIWSELPRGSLASVQWWEQAQRYNPDYLKLWEQAVADVVSSLRIIERALHKPAYDVATTSQVLEALHCFDSRISGAGTVAAAAAIYLASLFVCSPIEGVVRAAFALGADTDTIASMTGGLLGCMLGSSWLQNVKDSIQDSQCLENYACQLIAPKQEPVLASPMPRINSYQLTKWKNSLFESLSSVWTGPFDSQSNDRAVILIDGRKARGHYEFNLKASATNSERITCQLQVEDEQTIYVSKLLRKHDPQLIIDALRTSHSTDNEALLSYPLEAESSHAAISPCLQAGCKVLTASFAASLAFYRDCLGLTIKQQNHSTISFEQGIVLVQAQYLASLSEALDKSQIRSLVYIHCADIHTSFSRVQSLGLPIISELKQWKNNAIHSFCCLDPDGNIVEVFGKVQY